MSLTIVLAVGVDTWLLSTQSPAWKSAGYITVSAASPKEAIEYFRAGDFDLVLLGDSLSLESKQRLGDQIRATGARTPVIWVEGAANKSTRFADAVLHSDDSSHLLTGIVEVLASHSSQLAPHTIHSAAPAQV